MLFKDFANILFINCAGTKNKHEFFLELFDRIIRDPQTAAELKASKDDKYNPFSKLQRDTIERLFRGGALNPKKLRIVYNLKNQDKFAKYINAFGQDIALSIEADIKKHLPDFNAEEGDIGYACADLFVDIINTLIGGNSTNSSGTVSTLATVANLTNSFYYDPVDNKIHINDTVIPLPPQLSPPTGIADDEDLYVTKLLAAYAEASGISSISKNEINTLKRRHKENFDEQRINYYSAIRISRFLRESFNNGEDELKTWKSESYDYISNTLRDEYDNGYKRLVEVLKTVVNCSTTAVVDRCKSLIGPKERKGVCHLIANDNNSGYNIDWVDYYE
ncbi:hypothetical protein FDC62_06100 [Clostridium botulinum]|uniref:ABC-three component system protein n=1 Tax=Clostridium botulinum TaxID=1491 RepID=UPI00052CBFED|nr:ABC-three component system protein [Clostridium botulinum]KGM94337.1 hypothetical protein Z956_08085 [Clostridium botulinum D str. CCUG 7971]NFO97781.1 hypothetical protein [Clostridium botulinum]OOV51051.1 hypothetical protein B1A66_11140 [Clostridium botulinum D/C]OOV53939.1 hypothetical protein B1A67_11805 [Clostridium botulinum D/C]OOV54952.1 hypothetical protein B0673_09420 [Clostridium botulinum D/C]